MRHVGQKTGFQLVGAPQMIGPLVEFGIESHDAAIGVLQFLIEVQQLVAAPFEFLKLEQHLAVLLADLLDRIGRRIARQGLGELRDANLAERCRVSRQRFRDRDPRSLLRPGLDRKISYQTLRAAQSNAQPGTMAWPLDRLARRRNARAAIGNDDFERSGAVGPDVELDCAAAAVLDRVAGDFRDRGRDAGLRVQIVAKQFRNPAGAAARQDDVGIAQERNPQQARFHRGARNTTTEQSSRSLRYSRNRTPAISAGCAASRPGNEPRFQRPDIPSECRISVGSPVNG